MNSETEFKVEEQDGVPVVRVIGSLDHYNVPRFRSIIADLLSKSYNRIIVDMSEVDFMDSGGLSGIIFGLKRLSEAGGRLFLANCGPRIMRKLEISGFAMMPDKLVLSESVDKAVSLARN